MTRIIIMTIKGQIHVFRGVTNFWTNTNIQYPFHRMMENMKAEGCGSVAESKTIFFLSGTTTQVQKLNQMYHLNLFLIQ